MTADLGAGFTAPVADSQRCFRAVLDAMARPGRVHRIQGMAAPAPLHQAAAAVVLTLADHETPLWLDAAAEAALPWIAFHTGAPRATDAKRAAFALAVAAADIGMFHTGTHEMPETSTTVIAQIAALGSGANYRLQGPGLRAPVTVSIDGLPSGFTAQWQRNHALFPCGVDMILCAGDQLMALPRSVSISEV